MISQKGGFFMFLRAQLSAQMATIADFLVTILLVRLFEVYYVYATLAGAVYGGIVNCVINYKWTFKSTGKKTNVAVKFILVWVCSIWLNTWGTYALTESLAKIPWVRDTLSQYFGDFFIIPKMAVAVIVALFWNYNMHRFFVYRNINIGSLFRKSEKEIEIKTEDLDKNRFRHNMNYRDYLQQLIYKIINPLIHGMIKIGITPNFITTTGFILNVVAAGMFVYAGICGGRNDLAIVGWAGGVILFAGLFDMMDGRVARLGNMSSKFGALYDSVLDRYSELMTFFGICYYLSMKDYFFYALIAFVALIGSLMVSYVRARAEGLGIECKVGFMQRPERVVLTSLGALFCGVFKDITAFDPMLILIVPLAFVAVFANITAFARVRHCYKVMMK